MRHRAGGAPVRSTGQEGIRPMPKRFSAPLLGSALLAVDCGAPLPGPGPGTAPGPFYCNATAELKGVIAVEDPVPDRYIVVLAPPAPGLRPAAARIESLTRDYD